MRRKLIPFFVLLVLGVALVFATRPRAAKVTFSNGKKLQLREVVSGIRSPTQIEGSPTGDGLFVLAQGGQILRVSKSGVVSTFFDLSSKVRSGGETGLLGIAFHPKYSENHKFYLNYTAEDPKFRTVIAEFQTDPSTDLGILHSEKEILTIVQPYTNHNGGQIVFGPDGMLYIGMGDGGSREDPQGNGQNPRALLGKMLRIDVNRSDAGKAYAIPSDNPWASGADAAPEVWALGLRNPWRFSFDSSTGELWAADVGQDTLEEIDIIQKGKNYGWAVYEGTICQHKNECTAQEFVPPIYAYGRSEGICVTGGFVYRGKSFPELQGIYVYGDFGSGRIWGLRKTDSGKPAQNDLLLKTGINISTFGEDRDGELYVASYDKEKIFQLVLQ